LRTAPTAVPTAALMVGTAERCCSAICKASAAFAHPTDLPNETSHPVKNQLEVHIARKIYRSASGGTFEALRDMAFSLDRGTVGAVVGPSGSGKTTLLRIITGLDTDFTGEVRLPDHGRLGMVFQEPRLLPWRSVEQNVRLGAPDATNDDLDALFGVLGLAAHRRHYPGELSLGQARRVALARAFAVKPDLLVLDEPFVSLDAALAKHLQDELAALVTSRRVTTLIVTHNMDEAIGLADRLFLLSASPGRVIAEVPIARPRAQRSAGEVTAIQNEIARVLGKGAP
jgi:ABC-type nitrate/sulfonate/bicarbonate transport system ATPase subunit